jgi:crotonobetainyl-CoA:carnitine CoA-transferase CaiB-like acyl-CoA transferase
MLSQLKVLDLTSNLPGPYATMLLADLGAEVLKIERPPAGDPARRDMALAAEKGPSFESLNRSKLSLCLDLKSKPGQEIFLRLLEEYDILIEGFRPGVMDRLGLGYEALKKRRPDLIYLALSGYGQDGPWSQKAGHDLNYLALSGAAGLNGSPEGGLSAAGVQIADVGGGSDMALFGLLAAVIHRQATGRGSFVDVSMYHSILSWVSISSARALAGLEEGRPGRTWATGGWPCYRIYRTADGGHMTLGALEPHFWSAFCRAIDRPDLEDKAFGGPRVAAEVEAVFASRTREEWIAFLADHDCCCEPVLSVEEAFESAQVREGGLGDLIEDGGKPRFRMGCPVRFSGYRPKPPGPAPDLGRDAEQVLTSLGYSNKEIERLKEEKVI